MSRLRVENPQPRHQFTLPFADTSFLRKFIAGNNSEATTAEGIYRANIGLIAEADALLANLNPFRGTEPDSGTVFEIGYAIALGKRVVGYLEDARTVEVTARKRYFFRKTRRVSVRSAARRFSMARTSGPTMSQPPNSGRLI